VQLANSEALVDFLKQVQEQDPESGIAVYGDAEAAYGRIIDVLNLGAENDLKMVLATTPRPLPETKAKTSESTTNTEE
jgi:biopolymer transport protein ExbD